jgi:hypothetical protein
MSPFSYDPMTHAGWSNYETWATNLWLTNDQATYNLCRAFASESRREAAAAEQVTKRIWTVREATTFRLADLLRRHVQAQNPIAAQASVYADLLNAALSEVNWTEIAEAFLDAF